MFPSHNVFLQDAIEVEGHIQRAECLHGSRLILDANDAFGACPTIIKNKNIG
jgi:hypothetical protein